MVAARHGVANNLVSRAAIVGEEPSLVAREAKKQDETKS